MEVADRNVVAAMIRFGGSFVSALGEACFHADAQNLAKIKATWPEYWAEYTEMARMDSSSKP